MQLLHSYLDTISILQLKHENSMWLDKTDLSVYVCIIDIQISQICEVYGIPFRKHEVSQLCDHMDYLLNAAWVSQTCEH